MNLSDTLKERSTNKCELCFAEGDLTAYTVPPKNTEQPEDQVVLCSNCKGQVENPASLDKDHWRCLNESMWNTVPAVQVMVYRLLQQLSDEDWAGDLLGMMYMEEETQEWAQSQSSEIEVVHKDSNGNVLQAGDTVNLIQDLNVKGANFTAKRGTAVRRIRLVPDNAEHIEGKVEGQQIVILTKYVKKS